MTNVVQLQRQPRVMECSNCNGDEFVLRADYKVYCATCYGMINATWAVKSSSPPKDGPHDDVV